MSRPANKENHASINDLVTVPASLKGMVSASDKAMSLKHKCLHATVSTQKDQNKGVSVSSVSGEDSENIPAAESLGNLVNKAKTAIKRKCAEMGIGKHPESGLREQTTKRTKKRDAIAGSVWTGSALANCVQSEARQKPPSRRIRNIELASDATMIALPSEDIFDQEGREFEAIGGSSRFSYVADDNNLESQLTVIAPSSPLPFILSNDDDDDFFDKYDEAAYTADNTLVHIDALDVEDLFGSLDAYAPSDVVAANHTEIDLVEKADSMLSKSLSTEDSANTVSLADTTTKYIETGAAVKNAGHLAVGDIDNRLTGHFSGEE
ncbi:hypothetical protein LPJ73_007626, partial [Coemansia sp. RSA 2703]